jgi:hypothetical protein
MTAKRKRPKPRRGPEFVLGRAVAFVLQEARMSDKIAELLAMELRHLADGYHAGDPRDILLASATAIEALMDVADAAEALELEISISARDPETIRLRAALARLSAPKR